MKYPIILFSLGVLLCCNQRQKPGPATNNNENLLKSAPVSNLTDSVIIALIFGNAQKYSDGNCCRHSGKFYGTAINDSTDFLPQHWERIEGKKQTDYYVEISQKITVDSIEKHLVILSGEGFDFHPAPGIVAGAIISGQPGNWHLESFENDIAVLGNFGIPIDDVEIIPLQKAYAIILKKGGIWQGLFWELFTVILWEDGKFKEVLAEPLICSSNNWASSFPSLYAYTSRIEFVPSKGIKEDMLLHFQGTIIDSISGHPKLLDKKFTFQYKNGFYSTAEHLPD